MSKLGEIERKAQQRIAALFRDQLGYDYMGNWQDREDNQPIEVEILRDYLKGAGYSEELIDKALFELDKAAYADNKSLYDINKDVYALLRYGVKVKAEIGENTQTVWLIDWQNPINNHFAIAEEVTVRG
ncbi:MAG: type I restriction endonuclease, partial [Candidatus Cloacimonas sp.]|nr:type I restriction endonuclease [Candidatus Cloacimonas sp.]